MSEPGVKDSHAVAPIVAKPQTSGSPPSVVAPAVLKLSVVGTPAMIVASAKASLSGAATTLVERITNKRISNPIRVPVFFPTFFPLLEYFQL